MTLLLAANGALAANGFQLASPTIKPDSTLGKDQVFNGFGCSGGNLSPALQWSGAPEDTRSYALTVYDPDAPTGSGWWHWMVYNLPATVGALPANAGKANSTTLPRGALQGRNDFGTRDFGGACPPPGDKPHRYIFTVYALKVDRLDLPADASAALIGYNINANKLGSATFTARYGR